MPTTKANPITLALSGGGAKCAAQAGVLTVLADARIPVGAISGISGSGPVAILHALGWSPAAIRDYMADTQLLDVWEFDPQRRAIFGPDKIRAHVRKAVGNQTFADLRIPVTLITADLYTGREVRIDSGPLDEALMAMTAIPGIFAPVVRDGMTLVDGGLVNPLPVDAARLLGPRVVAVDVLYLGVPSNKPTQIFESRGPIRYAAEVARRLQLNRIMEDMYQAVAVASRRLVEQSIQLCPPDVLIQPALGHVGLFAFDLANEAYRIGEEAARAALPQIESLARPQPGSVESWRRQLQSALRHVTLTRKLK